MTGPNSAGLNKVVLITGASSGIGEGTARQLAANGARVVLGARRTERLEAIAADIEKAGGAVRLRRLDVTDREDVEAFAAFAESAFGPIDVLVNNAGIGWLNALEGTSMDLARDIFETNTIGTMAMTQAVLPQFRQRKEGVIVNVTSSVTLKPLHLLSVYTASKAAVNAFSEVLALELEPFNIRVRTVLPGRAPDTRFGETAQSRIKAAGGFPDAYAELVQGVFANWAQQPSTGVTLSADVAEAVWRAATDPSCPPRLAAGADAAALFAQS